MVVLRKNISRKPWNNQPTSQQNKDCQPTVETVKSLFKKIYVERILIDSKSHKSAIRFRKITFSVKIRMNREAGINKQDVQSGVYDTSHYAPSGFLMIPESS